MSVSYNFLLILLLCFAPLEFVLGQEVIKEQSEPQKEEEFLKHHLFVSAGYGFRTAQTADGMDRESANHIDGLKRGFNIHGSYGFFIDPNLGPSVKYTQFFSSNTTRDLNTDVNILFIGGGISTRTFTSSNTLFNGSLHLGYVAYRELDTVSGVSVELTGKTVGIDGSVIFNLLVSESISLQLEAGYQVAALNKVKDASGNTYELEEPESLNRIDLNTGFKIHL